MKKQVLLFGLAFLGFGSFAQTGADAVSAEASNASSGILQNSPQHVQTRAVSVTSSVLPCGGGIDTLIASGACSYSWATDSLGINEVSAIDTLITGNLTSDTTFYLTGLEGELEAQVTMPAQSSTFPGNVRGYYFIAPMDMLITGLYIPQDASTGPQNVAVLLFDNQMIPPTYSLVTNAFTNLGTWNNFPANDTIFTCLAIDSGDVVGIYGQRNTDNSYGNNSAGIVIGGINVPIVRTGMQLPLTTNPMQDVWAEPSSSNISRVQFFYDITPTIETIPVFVNVPLPESATVSAAICQGDSIMIGGAYQTSAGAYQDSYFNVDGCDSVVTTNLVVNPLPSVTILSDSACVQDGLLPLNGTPAGGTFSGTAVSGANFSPATAGVGTHVISYTYADGNGCANSANGTVVVQDCAALGELALEGVRVFPNPVNDFLYIELPQDYARAQIQVYDASGKVVLSENIQTGLATIETAGLSEGMYVVEVTVNDKSNTYKLVKK
jgi:hypothetical protein